MDKQRYMISDAAALVNVESHVLRYWEEELELTVPRNEMGHRYYTKENIEQFLKIKADGAVPAYDGTDCKRRDCRKQSCTGKRSQRTGAGLCIKRNELSDEGTG